MSTPGQADVPLLYVVPPTTQFEEGCIEGTRQTVLATIQNWLTSPDFAASKVLWLRDISGSGKSAVARHIGRTLRHQLLCSFFFKSDIEAQSSTSGVIASLARDLARMGGPITVEIAQGSENARAGLREEFHAQITAPLCRHPPEQPSLILINALDESGVPSERAEFLAALTDEIPLLPPRVKVMVTSKSTQDINDAFNKLPTVSSDDDEDSIVYRLTFDVYGQENGRDLLKYVSHTFDRVARLKRKNGISLPERWPSTDQRKSLAAHANGLFLWVSVAVKYVACATDPRQALDQLLTLENRPSPEAAIDALYKHILHVAEECPNFDLHTYHDVLDLVISSPNPLSIAKINHNLHRDAGPTIAALMPVLSSEHVVRIVHQSFGEYVRDPHKCEPRFLISTGSPGMSGSSGHHASPEMEPARGRDSIENTPSVDLGLPIPSLITVVPSPSAQGLLDVTEHIVRTSISSDPVAGGGFGDIWLAQHKDGRRIAIKSLRVYESDERSKLEKSSAKELAVWSRLNHPNVLGLLGICKFSDGRIGMVSEWMPNGNVMKYTSNHPRADKLKMITDIAAGLAYLHSSKVVHGDLKGGNVVISADETARLVDFGLAKLTEETLTRSTTTGLRGTTRWMSNELVDPGEGLKAKATYASDVYALGMTALEILSGQQPFLDLVNEAQVVLAVTRGERPCRPSLETTRQLSDDMWELMNRCWHQDRDSRPNAEAVHAEMQQISRSGNSLELHPSNAKRRKLSSSAAGAH